MVSNVATRRIGWPGSVFDGVGFYPGHDGRHFLSEQPEKNPKDSLSYPSSFFLLVPKCVCLVLERVCGFLASWSHSSCYISKAFQSPDNDDEGLSIILDAPCPVLLPTGCNNKPTNTQDLDVQLGNSSCVTNRASTRVRIARDENFTRSNQAINKANSPCIPNCLNNRVTVQFTEPDGSEISSVQLSFSFSRNDLLDDPIEEISILSFQLDKDSLFFF